MLYRPYSVFLWLENIASDIEKAKLVSKARKQASI